MLVALTPEAGVVEARVVVGHGEQRRAARPPHRRRQRLAVVHRRLVQELCKTTRHSLTFLKWFTTAVRE